MQRTLTVAAVSFALWLAFGGAATAQTHCAHWNTEKFFESARADDVARCVAAGVDLETRAEYGATSLHYAAAVSELPSVIAALVAAGADLEARDEFGRTPLHLAAKDSETPSVIATLVDAGTCRSRPARNNRWSCSAPMPAN